LVRRGGVARWTSTAAAFNALTDEGMQLAVSSLTALTSLELWGCSKVTDEGMQAVGRYWAHVKVKEVQHRWFEQRRLPHDLQVRAELL
jgi:hypothetical protein